jgi:hypothetical protein
MEFADHELHFWARAGWILTQANADVR